MNSLVGVAAPSDPVGSFYSVILYSVEGGDVEQVCRTSKQFSCVCDCSLYLSLVLIYCMLLLFIFITCLIYLCLCCYMLGDCLLTLVFNQESHIGTSTLI